MLVLLLPSTRVSLDGLPKPEYALYTAAFLTVVELILLSVSAFAKKRADITLMADISVFIFVIIAAWTLSTAKFNVLRESLFPAPGIVLRQITLDWRILLEHIGASLLLIVRGYTLGLVTAIPLGLALGYSKRLSGAAGLISKFLGSIPPVVYIPYGIALLPTFKSVSVMVIFLASFWPILGGTMNGVLLIDKPILNSARVLNIGRVSMLFEVVLHAALPQILLGASQALTVSFILLTSAEMIAARSGLGYYVKNYSDLGNYTRTIVGVLVIGVMISAVFFAFNRLQKFLLRWR